MQPAFEREPYSDQMQTEIIESGREGSRDWVELADTIFYPEGGGQPADHGWINQVAVTDVQKAEGGILHFLEHRLTSGPAQLKLDWERRYDLMQQHTGQHLISALAADLHGWETTAFHLGEHGSDVELATPEISHKSLAELEDRVNLEIAAARPVTARRVSPDEFESLGVRSRGLPAAHEGSIRLVEIQGIDLNTCGGTHLRSTAELGTIKFLKTDPMRGGTRLYYVAGGRVRALLAQHESRAAELRSVLGTGDDAVVETARLKLEQLKEAQNRSRALEQELAQAVSERLSKRSGSLVEEGFKGAEMPFLQRLARSVVGRNPGKAVLLTSQSASVGGFFVLATGTHAAKQASVLGPQLAKLLGGRGGGSGSIYQGKCSGLGGRELAIKWLKEELVSR